MRVADLGGYRSGNPPVGRVTEVPSGDLTIPLALNRWAAFEGCVRADDEVAHTRNYSLSGPVLRHPHRLRTGHLTDLRFCCAANVVTASEAREPD